MGVPVTYIQQQDDRFEYIGGWLGAGGDGTNFGDAKVQGQSIFKRVLIRRRT